MLLEVVSIAEEKPDNTFESVYPLLTSAIFAGIVQLEITGNVMCDVNYYHVRLRYTKSLKIFCYTRATNIDDALGNIEQALNYVFKV